jgi:hypothetical protein
MEPVPETLYLLNHLTRLMAQEDYIKIMYSLLLCVKFSHCVTKCMRIGVGFSFIGYSTQTVPDLHMGLSLQALIYLSDYSKYTIFQFFTAVVFEMKSIFWLSTTQ